MSSRKSVFVGIILVCLLVGAGLGLVLDAETRVSAAGAPAPEPGMAPPAAAQKTLRVSGRSPELKFADASDLTPASGALEGGRLSSIRAVDLNLDGDLDLISGYSVNGRAELSVRFGRDGEFGEPQAFRFDVSGIDSMFVDDVVGVDGYDDVITAYDRTLSVSAGNKDGGLVHLGSRDLGVKIDQIITADVDRDGLAETFVMGGKSIRILRGNGDLLTAPMDVMDLKGSYRFIRSGDFNADYFEDLAVAGADGVEVFYGDGRGGFGKGKKIGRQNATGLVVADTDGDHFPGIAISHDSFVTVFETKLGRGFSAGRSFFAGEGATEIDAGFLDYDGLADLAVINYGSNRVSVLLNRAGRRFEAPIAMDLDAQPTTLRAGSFGPYQRGGLMIGKQGGGVVLAIEPAAVTLQVSTLNDENDCPTCTSAQLIALTTPNGAPGGGTGISLREAITSINNDFTINGDTGSTIGFAGLNPASPGPLADTPTPVQLGTASASRLGLYRSRRHLLENWCKF